MIHPLKNISQLAFTRNVYIWPSTIHIVGSKLKSAELACLLSRNVWLAYWHYHLQHFFPPFLKKSKTILCNFSITQFAFQCWQFKTSTFARIWPFNGMRENVTILERYYEVLTCLMIRCIKPQISLTVRWKYLRMLHFANTAVNCSTVFFPLWG